MIYEVQVLLDGWRWLKRWSATTIFLMICALMIIFLCWAGVNTGREIWQDWQVHWEAYQEDQAMQRNNPYGWIDLQEFKATLDWDEEHQEHNERIIKEWEERQKHVKVASE
jgi:hypothetical protein